MAPLPPNNTDRFFLDYSTCGFDHTLEVRTSGSVDASAVSTFLDTVLTELHDLLFQITIIGLRFQAATTDFSVPQTWSGDATYGGSAGVAYQTAQYLDFVGRSSGGRRVRLAVFGVTFTEQGDNYRVTPAEQGAIGDVVSTLNGASGIALAIDANQPVWKSYANCGVNAYWRNKVR